MNRLFTAEDGDGYDNGEYQQDSSNPPKRWNVENHAETPDVKGYRRCNQF